MKRPYLVMCIREWADACTKDKRSMCPTFCIQAYTQLLAIQHRRYHQILPSHQCYLGCQIDIVAPGERISCFSIIFSKGMKWSSISPPEVEVVHQKRGINNRSELGRALLVERTHGMGRSEVIDGTVKGDDRSGPPRRIEDCQWAGHNEPKTSAPAPAMAAAARLNWFMVAAPVATPQSEQTVGVAVLYLR